MGKAEEFSIPDGASMSVSPVVEPSLANDATDPFKKHKTDEKRFHYRALNKKATNINVKEAMGYQTIGGTEYGDLVLAKIDRGLYEARKRNVAERSRRAVESARESFKEEARRSGVKTFDK